MNAPRLCLKCQTPLAGLPAHAKLCQSCYHDARKQEFNRIAVELEALRSLVDRHTGDLEDVRAELRRVRAWSAA